MSGRHEQSSSRVTTRWVALLATLAVTVAALVIGAGTSSAATRHDAQLALTGLVDDDNPAGGSQLGIKPGDSIRFSASAAPTQKAKSLLAKLGLDGVLSSLAKFQVTADFSKLPGGSKGTVLTDTKTKTLTFSKVGKYSFTFKAQKVTLLGGLLGGSKVSDINLDGNQLEKAGIKLNADNEYVGTIVVAKDPPKGGISVQLPKVSVKPKAGNVQLPKVTVPGASLPTVKTDVPKIKVPNVSLPGTKSSSSSSSSGSPQYNYNPPGLTVPDRVVPNGTGGDSAAGTGGGGGGYYTGLLPANDSRIGNPAGLPGGTSDSSDSGSATGSGAKKGADTVDLAAETPRPSGQLPVVLAIIAVLALAVVGGTYARLYLLRKQTD